MNKLVGYVILIGGVYALCIYFNLIKPKYLNSEQLEKLRKTAKICGPIMTIGGLLLIFGIIG